MFKKTKPGVTDLEVHDADTPPRKTRKHRQWGGTALALLAAIAGLVLGRLGYLYPAFDVFAQFGMQFTLMAIAFAIAALLPRYKAILGFGLTAAMLAGYGAWPHLVSNGLPKGPFPTTTDEIIFTAAHFNIHAENADINATAQEIMRLDADVVALVEFDSTKRPILDAVASVYPYRRAYHDMGQSNFAIVSKHPIEEVLAKAVWEGPSYAAARLGGKLNGLWVYAVHTTRFPHSRAQLKQVQALASKLTRPAGAFLVMGDFNATPFSRLPGIIESGLSVRRVTHLPTWPAPIGLPQLAIDHIFISDQLRVVADQQIGESAGSDHYPIIMTFALKPQ